MTSHWIVFHVVSDEKDWQEGEEARLIVVGSSRELGEYRIAGGLPLTRAAGNGRGNGLGICT